MGDESFTAMFRNRVNGIRERMTTAAVSMEML